MDPDRTLSILLALFTEDTAPTWPAVREHVEALEQWHSDNEGRGYLPRWPHHLDSGLTFWRMAVGAQHHKDADDATLQFRAECIAILTRVQVALECRNSDVYVASIRALGTWAYRALDSEDPA